MATNKINFTKGNIEDLPLPAKGQREAYHDTKTPGLQLRVSSTGVKTFCVRRRNATGTVERVTLGSYPAMAPEQARKKAMEVNVTISKGESPTAEKKRAKLESKTLREAFDDYLSRRTLKPQTVFDINRCMKEIYPDWLDKPMTKITGDMVVQRHQRYGAEHSEARANLGMRYLRAVFNFAMAEYQDAEGEPIIKTNPAKKLSATKSWHRVDRRQTVIKPHELGAWVNAVLGLPGENIRDYFMTVLLTGMRREEALKLVWADVDMTGKTFTIRDPKNHQDHTLPMSDYLFELLARRKADSVAEHVFADSQGRKISNFRYAQASVEKASGVSFCIHDLRRTFATIAESLDIPAYALKRLLNHANGADVTAGYIVANVERLREPMQKITDYILKMAGIRQTAEVIPFNIAKQA
ncbi:MAG: integrase arm-type DNA-binding domain-containing protein [Proteobacteria bacterium]|nr:integrase arm-type DNA-binding domain-containing protein [Pseudomonadota bacterium]